jgi:hypothetical protein
MRDKPLMEAILEIMRDVGKARDPFSVCITTPHPFSDSIVIYVDRIDCAYFDEIEKRCSGLFPFHASVSVRQERNSRYLVYR